MKAGSSGATKTRQKWSAYARHWPQPQHLKESSMADLIAKLRNMTSKRYDYSWAGWVQEQCTNAADRIDELQRENTDLRAALQAQQGDAGNPASGDALDAARFVFSCTEPEAMLQVELAALSTDHAIKDIEWWRAQIDAAMLAARREG
jgi:hypothetical protein